LTIDIRLDTELAPERKKSCFDHFHHTQSLKAIIAHDTIQSLYPLFARTSATSGLRKLDCEGYGEDDDLAPIIPPELLSNAPNSHFLKLRNLQLPWSVVASNICYINIDTRWSTGGLAQKPIRMEDIIQGLNSLPKLQSLSLSYLPHGFARTQASSHGPASQDYLITLPELRQLSIIAGTPLVCLSLWHWVRSHPMVNIKIRCDDCIDQGPSINAEAYIFASVRWHLAKPDCRTFTYIGLCHAYPMSLVLASHTTTHASARP